MLERRTWWRLLQAAAAAAVIGLAVRSLARNWSEFQGQSIEWDIAPGWLVAAVLLVWLAYALLVEAWRRVVRSLRQRLGYWDAARICMLANLGKYLPGKVWSVAGAAALAQRAGVAPSAAVASAVVLQALALASGVVLVGALAPKAAGVLDPAFVWLALAVAVAAVGGLFALSSARALRGLRRLLPPQAEVVEPIPPAVMLAAFAANLLAWSIYGLAFLFLMRGLTPAARLTWQEASSVFTASYIVGLVAVFAPGGIGPRESVFVLLLTGPLGPKLAVALALATRILLTVTELGAALPFLIRRTGRPGVATNHQGDCP